MKKLLFAGIVASALFLTACNEEKDSSTEVAKETNEEKMPDKMEYDAAFAVEVCNGGMMEVQLSQLAETNSSSAAVKDFAKMMVSDHSAANEELKGIAAKNNITLPSALSENSQETYNEMAKKKGADFDKAYVNAMVDGHKSTIDKFQDEAKDGTNADLKAFASKTLPTLQAHKQKIDAIDNTMK